VFAPDLADAPTLAAPIDSRAVLEGEFTATWFGDPLGPDTGLALGETSNVDEHLTAEPGVGATRAPAAAIAAFDLATGERLWQVDLLEAAGLGPEGYLLAVRAWPDGRGGVCAGLTVDLRDFVYVTVAADGAVLSTLRTGATLIEAKGGIVLMVEVPDVFAYAAEDLTKELWRAGFAGLGGYADPLFHRATGTFWPVTQDGFVDAATGERFGFGADAAYGTVRYTFAAATPEPVVLRLDYTAGTLARLDAAGAALWEAQLPPGATASGLGFTPDAILMRDDMQETADIWAVDLGSGETRWRAPGGKILGARAAYWGVAADGAVLARRTGIEGDVVAFDAATGDELFGVACGDGCQFGLQGRSAAYFSRAADGAVRIEALSLAEGGAELWAADVPRPAGSEGSPEFHHSGAHLWIEFACEEGGQLYDVAQLLR
jgi:outer membrane protein assembly factor BamB